MAEIRSVRLANPADVSGLGLGTRGRVPLRPASRWVGMIPETRGQPLRRMEAAVLLATPRGARNGPPEIGRRLRARRVTSRFRQEFMGQGYTFGKGESNLHV